MRQACPQLAEANIRLRDGISRFDPTETWAAQDFRSAKTLFVASLKRYIVPLLPGHTTSGGRGRMAIHIRRREFIFTLGGAAAAWPLAARAQQAHRMRRISVVNVITATDPDASPRIAAFELGLRRAWLGHGARSPHRLLLGCQRCCTQTCCRKASSRNKAGCCSDRYHASNRSAYETARCRRPYCVRPGHRPGRYGVGRKSWLVPAATLQGLQTLSSPWAANGWRYLKEIAPHVENGSAACSIRLLPPVLEDRFCSQSKLPRHRSQSNQPLRQFTAWKTFDDALSRLARDQDVGLIVHPDTFTTPQS